MQFSANFFALQKGSQSEKTKKYTAYFRNSDSGMGREGTKGKKRVPNPPLPRGFPWDRLEV